MRTGTVVFVGLLASALFTGCLAGEEADEQEPEDGSRPSLVFRPTNDRGWLDLVHPTPPPRDTAPTCRVMVAASAYRVLDLSTAVAWEATSDRTQELRLSLATGDSGNDVSIEGGSPLNLTAVAFNVTAGERFGLVLSLIGKEPLDPTTEPQTFRFETHYVAQLDADQVDAERGVWSEECPE